MGGYMNATVDKAEIENAIEEINGVIMDFTDTVKSLTSVKNLLYELLENNAEKETDPSCGGTDQGDNDHLISTIITNLVYNPKNGDVEFIKKLWDTKKLFDMSISVENGTGYIGPFRIIRNPEFDYEKNTVLVTIRGSVEKINP
jgi:hypothetical protein